MAKMPENLAEGAVAPDFDLPATDGRQIRLGDLKGRKVVLYFYPKDDTSGCTREAVDFSRLKDAFDAVGAVIIGVSPDDVGRHEKFRAKHDLTVDLASDPDKGTLEAYGVWVEKSMYGRRYMGVERSTFLIGDDGRILRVWRKVKVPGHADEVLSAVKAS
jgi:thioredoxin-dependent peroxiredoxin